MLAAVPFAARQSEDLSSGGFEVPGSQSAAVDDALERFPGVQRAQLAAVLIGERGAGEAQLRAAVDRVAAAAGPIDGVSLPDAARARALEQAAAGGTVIVPLRAEVDEDGATDVASDLRDRLGVGDGARDGVATHFVGQGALWAAMQELSKEDLAKAESAGFPLVLLILLLVFGSLAAAALPLALGFVSVLVTGALIHFLSQSMEMSVFVTNMASMIGIGVAVDYSLFVLARYREEVAAGRSPDDARGVALATSGLAVLFSGLTVIVSLAGLWMIDNTAIRSMALGAMLVVGVAVLTAITLLPALIGVLGRRTVDPLALAAAGPAAAPARDRRARVLAALDRRGDATPGAGGRGHVRRAARARRPGARHEHGHRRARPVPARPRDPHGLRGRRGRDRPGRLGSRAGRARRRRRRRAGSRRRARAGRARRRSRHRERRRADRGARRRAPCS